MGNKNDPPDRIYHYFTEKSPRSSMFEKATVVHKTGCGVKAYTSLLVPSKGNALAIGDAAAYVEVENQGALMCGFHAGKAVAKELTGEKGFEEYTQWWQKSFEFNGPDALQVAQGYALVPTYSDDELDYLFALTEDTILPGTISQYRSPKLMWDAILRHREKIARERPELSEKIKRNQEMTLKGTF
jgi:flavin-dependent dehydrogenase